jgi:hypothetical protein
LKGAATADVVANLKPQDQNAAMYKRKQVLIVPPLVSVSILEANTLQPATLVPILSAKFQEYDRTSSTTKACTILHPVLEFLWAVHHKLVPTTVVGLDISNDAQEWASRLHMVNIHPLGPPLFLAPPPHSASIPQDQSMVNSIVGELRLLRDAQDKQFLQEISIDEERKNQTNGWEKFPEEIQTMILRMTAMTLYQWCLRTRTKSTKTNKSLWRRYGAKLRTLDEGLSS